ncbi:uncharacterized protein LOC141671192 isoform X1 [Apium graveolens]|uniref:uncharacterized protein LOC141671192 isoform X1 n=1 Tax=Apium graveolens TaxID=4045 RepID=UPI003D7BD804
MENRQEKKIKVKKQEEFMEIKLKHKVFVGGKRESSTPTTSWKIGLAQSDGSLAHVQNSNIPIVNTLSARKLGANLKKTNSHIKDINMNKGDSGISRYYYEKEKSVEHQSHMVEPPDEAKEQPSSSSSLRGQIAATLFQHHQFVRINGHGLQPVSLASPNTSLEVAPYYSAVTPASPLDFTDQGELIYNAKTSAELLKVLNQIWSLEEQHAANLSLIKTLQRELEHSQAQNDKLLQEKERDRRKINKMMEQNASDIAVRRVKEQDRTRNAVLSVSNELGSERTLRKHSESLHRKAQELAEVKSFFSNSLEEIKRERKARILLENLCDEFAIGITEYEQKARSLKHRPDKGVFCRERPEQLILHISESWLDERMQMKVAATPCAKSTIVEKLSMEIESFLQSKQAVRFKNVNGLTFKTAKRNSLRRFSLESFHLNDAASAPRNGDCEEDSIGSGLKSLDFDEHFSSTRTNDASKLLNDCGKMLTKSNPSCNKIQPGGVFKSNKYHSSSQNQFHKHSFSTMSSDENNVRVENYRKSETTETSQEGKQKRAESHDLYQDHVLHSLTRNYSLSRNDGKLLNEKPCTDDSLDHSASSSHHTIKQEIQLRITTSKPEVSESSRTGLQGIKTNSLKARLLEAKLESRHSLMKNPKAPKY